MADHLHLAGVVLPEGDYRDLWVVDGLIRTEPVAEAQTIATGVWLMPSLVDAHCHVGLERQGAVSDDRAEQHALAERAAGALLLRDAGSPADTRWMDQRVDLPKIIRAGRHIARPKRYLRNYGEEVEPDELVAEVERQAARGDGWVKLVGDWIDRDVGDLTSLWPADVAEAAIVRAHELGCRVTAHVFGEQAAASSLRLASTASNTEQESMSHHRLMPSIRCAGADHDPARQFRVYAKSARKVSRICQAYAALYPVVSSGLGKHWTRASRSCRH